ncbi:3-methyl-2-oxobutanoate hydroxymethyltransferase [Bacillus fonticola]|uniref:3-methyl-2-oxobutanoate hydroxymethyltransferase n=1 Tax=Bacillus fonticola TaxID=2728853 RepID=UPI001472B7D5|nr:3-methyl-2-oxobutanoate hydroxymethyltransferase [Bacillus fonticola]
MHSTETFKKWKQEAKPIVMVTAYDYPSAKMAEEAGVDVLLVGDSLGMVVLGYDSTIPVTVDDMIHHGKAVRRGAKETFVVVDLPFLSYHGSIESTIEVARRVLQETGADALKLEGSGDVFIHTEILSKAGVPVVSHLGLTPQSAKVLGGFKVQGKSEEAARQLMEDAKRAQAAGACALVLECVPHQLAERISTQLDIPTVGIGAGAGCDGQVLVYHDILQYGINRVPKFVKSYESFQDRGVKAIASYANDVRTGSFPTSEHQFTMKDDVLERLYGGDS